MLDNDIDYLNDSSNLLKRETNNNYSPTPKITSAKNLEANAITPKQTYDSRKQQISKKNDLYETLKQNYHEEIERVKSYYKENIKVMFEENKILSEFIKNNIEKKKKEKEEVIASSDNNNFNQRKISEICNKVDLLEEKNNELLISYTNLNMEHKILNETLDESFTKINELNRINNDLTALLKNKDYEISELYLKIDAITADLNRKNDLIIEMQSPPLESKGNIQKRSNTIIRSNLYLSDNSMENFSSVNNAKGMSNTETKIDLAFQTHISQLNMQNELIKSENAMLKKENDKLIEENAEKSNEIQIKADIFFTKDREKTILLNNLKNEADLLKQSYIKEKEEKIKIEHKYKELEHEFLFLKNMIQEMELNHSKLENLNHESRKELDALVITSKELRTENLKLKEEKQSLDSELFFNKEKEFLKKEDWINKNKYIESLKEKYESYFKEMNEKNMSLVQSLMQLESDT